MKCPIRAFWKTVPLFLLLLVLASHSARSSGVEVRLPPDLTFHKTVGRDQAVTFRHTTHVELAEGKCIACHPEPFRILHPVRTTSHEAMNAGGSCGACHNGARAFGTTDEKSCSTCHTGPSHDPVAASPALAPGPKDVTLHSSHDSPGAVVFRHATHAASGCNGCHPVSFAMKAGGTKVASPSDFHGRCGKCHAGNKAFAVEDPDACSRCHSAGGGAS